MTDIIYDINISEQAITDIYELIHVLAMLTVFSHLFYFIFMIAYIGLRKERKPEIKKINDMCSICLDCIKYEAQLLCSHSYCANCIISYGKQRFDLHNIECPMCRRVSKLIFCEFQKNEENKESYEMILNYNYELTSVKSSLCLSYDVVIFARYFAKQLSRLRGIDRKREISILLIILIFFTILFPISLKISNDFELIEDIVFYVSLIIVIAEIFYRNFRHRINTEYLSSHETNRQ